jgi:hypothetical protein
VIRIPRSYRGPHRVIFKEWNRFFARSSAGRYQPNVEELRSLFAFPPALAEQMRAFRFDRVTSIAADQTPVPLSDISRLVLHVIPFSHFDLRPAVSLRALIQNKTRLDPIGTPADATRLNFDGLLAISYPENGTYQSYVQASRGGAIEAVCSSITGSGGSIDIRRVEHYIVERSLE